MEFSLRGNQIRKFGGRGAATELMLANEKTNKIFSGALSGALFGHVCGAFIG